jgi:hypothetical protein
MPSNLSSSHLIALCKKRRVFGGSVGPGLLASFRRSGGHFGYGKVSQTLLLKQNIYETRRSATTGKVPTVKTSLLGGKRLDARRGGEVQLEMCVTYHKIYLQLPPPSLGQTTLPARPESTPSLYTCVRMRLLANDIRNGRLLPHLSPFWYDE